MHGSVRFAPAVLMERVCPDMTRGSWLPAVPKTKWTEIPGSSPFNTRAAPSTLVLAEENCTRWPTSPAMGARTRSRPEAAAKYRPQERAEEVADTGTLSHLEPEPAGGGRESKQVRAVEAGVAEVASDGQVGRSREVGGSESQFSPCAVDGRIRNSDGNAGVSMLQCIPGGGTQARKGGPVLDAASGPLV